MNKNEQHIDDLFNKAFDGAQEMPPDSVWENIEKQLDETSIETLFKTTFENGSIEPPVGIWAKIQQNLWMKDFMRFTPNKINIYYTSLVAVVAGLGLFMANNKDESKQIPSIFKNKQTQIINNTLGTKSIQKQSLTTNNNILVHEQSQIIKSTTKTNEPSKTLSQVASNSSNSNNKIAELPSGQIIIGDTVICIGTDHSFELRGDISNCELKWNINPKSATIEKLSKNKIFVNCNKAGSYTISAEISNGSNSKIIEYQTKAIEPAKPNIIGSSKVCEGTQAQFKMANTHYFSKIYSWEVAINKYSNLSSGVIIVDCKTPGYDTISVRDINTQTGCNNTALYPIIIFPKPDADFKFTDNGDGSIEFINTSKCGQKSMNCKQTVKWFVNDQTFTKNTINVDFSDNGIYSATLEVQNEFNCKETIKKDVTIDIQRLFVPNAFVSGNENNMFIPKGENLATYTIEIFDASNKKLWESTQLNDGKPSEGWNGEVDGQVQSQGTYYWRIKATFKDGTVWKGTNIKGRYQTFGTFILLKK